ncbi:hypothetical protein B9Y66_18455 [Stenotrophomonas maltophilia]|nr:hypothetical protein B9Y66_18455 [Stenotrophomonas maltophilia]
MLLECPIAPHERPEVADAVSARNTARELLLAGQGQALDALFVSRDDVEGPRTGLGSAQWLMQQLIAPWLEEARLMELLRGWIAECPQSYHAWLVLGAAWGQTAARIRSARCANQVGRGQWIGAGLARDHAVACFLQALACDPRGRQAWHRLFRVTCYLGEPQWLLDQQVGKVPDAYPDTDGHDELIWRAGLAHVATLGGALQQIPSLPACLAPRLPHEFEDGKIYWLRQALAVSPNDLDLLGDYLYFLYPRWGGSHEQMQGFIDGPICTGLTEAQRNDLRELKENDWIGMIDDSEDPEDTAQVRESLDALLAADLLPDTRVRALRAYTRHLAYQARTEMDGEVCWNKAEMQRVYAMLVEMFELMPYAFAERSLYTLEQCVAHVGIEDRAGLMRRCLELEELLHNDACALLWLDVARQCDAFGLAGDAPLAAGCRETRFDLALRMAEAHGTDVGQHAFNLYDGIDSDAGIALFERLVARGHAGAMLVYSGELSPDAPPTKRGRVVPDAARSAALLEQAAAADHPVALCNWGLRRAKAFYNDGCPEARAEALRCYRRVNDVALPHEEAWSYAMKTLVRMLWEGAPEEQHEAVHTVLVRIWLQDDADLEAWASRFFADAFLSGIGVAANRWLASVWLERACEREPDDPDVADLQDRLQMKGGWLGGLRWRRAVERDRHQIDPVAYALTFGEAPPNPDAG